MDYRFAFRPWVTSLLQATLGACVLTAGTTGPALAVPSFARQTGMTCAACHTVIPELTPFGREFKLNGYTIDNLRQIKGQTMERRETLSLNAVPPLSVMVQVSYTHTASPLPDSALTGALAKDGEILFPQQVSLFYAGKIADNLGAFMQLTYDGAADHFAIDNTDIRYVRSLHVAEPTGEPGAAAPQGFFASHDVLLGVTLNNNVTVQDVWNTTPAWGFPYAGSSVAPGPIAGTKVEGGLSAAGLGVYAWIDHALYAEFSAYSAASNGGVHPLDSTQAGVLRGLAPYWRVGYEYRWDRNSLFAGAYGLQASVLPGAGQPLSGPTDRFTDAAVDAQYQFISDDHIVTLLGTYIHENQRLDATFPGAAANSSDSLKTLKATAEYSYRRTIGGAVGFFSSTGSTDSLLYPNDGSINGSATGSPDDRGYILEVNYLPFLNTKLQVQYVGYTRFNGNGTNYAGIGRNASDNNTLYLLCWLNF